MASFLKEFPRDLFESKQLQIAHDTIHLPWELILHIYIKQVFFFVEDAGCDLGDYLSVTTAQALPKS